VHTPRPRRAVSPATIVLLRPAFRYSPIRDAYVLRLIGGSRGPVLVVKPGVKHRRAFTAR
jgi:hypothetical protein